jgi:hypothetical protein
MESKQPGFYCFKVRIAIIPMSKGTQKVTAR